MENYIYIIFVFLGLVFLPAICSLLRNCGILPIRLFETYWKDSYNSCRKSLKQAQEELTEFKAEIYEKEVIKTLTVKIAELEKELAVVQGKKDSLYSCNETLTQALNNITAKNG